MAFSPAIDELEYFLEVLRRNGVREYSFNGLHVKLDPEVSEPLEDARAPLRAAELQRTNARVAEIQSPYHHPSLWPNGRPPAFPGNE